MQTTQINDDDACITRQKDQQSQRRNNDINLRIKSITTKV